MDLNPVNIKTTNNVYLANSRYIIHRGTTPPIDIIYNHTYSLFGYGRALVFLLLFMTVVFMGQQLSYKTDNIWITFGVVYLTLPTLNLAPSASNYNCYSFLYGFAWSTYL